MKPTQRLATATLITAAVYVLACTQPLSAADAKESAAEKQRRLIAILKSDAPPQDKAIPCKQLAIYGDKEAVPALAPLLENPDLSSWARIALQAIPGPEADAALRDAVPKLKGNLAIGVMNTIGIRRDAKAVKALAARLEDGDAGVAGAAAAALGNIGGNDAAKALNQAFAKAPQATRQSIAEGVLLCAERFLAAEKYDQAAQMYDSVRSADVPTQRKLEAMRGSILARQSDGIPMLLEQLRSQDKPVYSMALSTARELPGRVATDALGAELDRVTADRQVMLILAIADRHDAAVFPILLKTAEKSFKDTRVATLGLLDRFNDVSAVPVLLSGASDDDADVARAAKATLTRMEGKKVDTALMQRLPESKGKTRQVIIELAALRRIDSALPVVVSSVNDTDPAVRRAALTTLSTIGTEKQAGELVRVLSKTKNEDDREAIEKALTGIAGREGAKTMPAVLPLAKNEDSDLRIMALRILATVGGPEALSTVVSAVEDTDEAVQDEAVGTLATWPNNWPDDGAVADPLLKLTKSGRKPAYQVQGTRGYLLHLQESKKLSNEEKVTRINNLLPELKHAQQKRLAVATLGGIPTTASVESLVKLTDDSAVAEEACLAIVNITTGKNKSAVSKEVSRSALQTVSEKAKNEATRKKASDAVKAS